MAPDHTLVLRFALINIAALGLLGAAYLQNWLVGFTEATTWVMSLVISGVFVWGLAVCGFRIWSMSRSLRLLRAGTPPDGTDASRLLARLARSNGEDRALQAGMVRMEFANHVSAVRAISNSLVFLGLIGTVIGFIIGLSGIDAAATTDVDKVAPMITQLINGMSVALYTTLLGAVLSIWLNVNVRILTDGAVWLLSRLVEVCGEPTPDADKA